MAEVAGLALGMLGIAGLFTSCIENFDIVVRAKDFGEDFDLLCTHLSLQRIRLALWGETLGLLPSPPDRRRQVPYNAAIDREDIRPSIVACLCQLCDLLAKADVVTERYALESTASSGHAYVQEVTQTPKGMLVLRDSFQKFKERVRKNQKQKSAWEVTRWSVHDCAQFEALVDKIRKLLDGLESITNSLGLLELQHRRLLEEVDSVSDAQSLSLLQDVGSSDSAPAALRAISETASQTGGNLDISSFQKTDLLAILPRKAMLGIYQNQNGIVTGDAQPEGRRLDNLPVQEEAPHVVVTDGPEDTIESIPQHQRWMSALLASRPDARHMPVFSPNDKHYGEAIHLFKVSDDQDYRKVSGQLAIQGHAGFGLAQRIFIELRNIHRAAIPYISAVPVGDALDKILACIEGPPGTPYQGGIFWITVRITESQPPAMKFHTRIYHPNIDHTGKICADYAGWWQDSKMLNNGRKGVLCAAIYPASPNIEDPLVPEIAERYVTDYAGYCEAAQLYTQRYAATPRPADEDLVFSDENFKTKESYHYEAPDFETKAKPEASSLGDSVVTKVEEESEESEDEPAPLQLDRTEEGEAVPVFGKRRISESVSWSNLLMSSAKTSWLWS
ncbi:ubiquitin-conjugating enzyme [Apiospora arundinis]